MIILLVKIVVTIIGERQGHVGEGQQEAEREEALV